MTKLHEVAVYVVLGMPAWVWALVLGIGALNEYINRTGKTEAQTVLQGTAKFLLAVPVLGVVLVKFPLVGWVLTKVATPPDVNALPSPLPLPPLPPAGSER